MKIELLYFDGCPNYQLALANLKEALRELGLESEVETIRVESPEEAVKYRFLGSPSIWINGRDLEIVVDESTEYSMRCRRYATADSLQGFPSKELIKTFLLSMRDN